MPFQKGNKYGKGQPKRPEIEQLRMAIRTVESKKRKKLLIHFVERAYENDKVLTALGKKIIPDLSSVDSNLLIQPQTLMDIAALVKSRKDDSNTRK